MFYLLTYLFGIESYCCVLTFGQLKVSCNNSQQFTWEHGVTEVTRHVVRHNFGGDQI